MGAMTILERAAWCFVAAFVGASLGYILFGRAKELRMPKQIDQGPCIECGGKMFEIQLQDCGMLKHTHSAFAVKVTAAYRCVDCGAEEVETPANALGCSV